jgi:hypothetical protein
MKQFFLNLIKNPLAIITLHVSLYFICYCVLSFLGFIKGYPTNESLMQWDAGWYQSIVENGYSFNKLHQSNVAFFPLFPLIWEITSLSPLWISLVNLIFLFMGMLLLQRTYNISNINFLLLLSTPSLFFCYIPYTEALFFLGGSLIIYGLKTNNWIAVSGILIACLTRSASLLFIPVILFAKFYNYQPNRSNKNLIRETLILFLSVIISLLISLYLQYLDTGTFFSFFQQQENWNGELNIPTLYLTTWDESRLIWLDGLAFFIGCLALISCLILIKRKFIKKTKSVSSDFLFSIGYLAIVTLIILFYASVDNRGGTSIYSLNRLIFSTPFFFVFLIILLKRTRLNKKGVLYFLLVSTIIWLLFNMHGYLQNLDKFALPYFKTKIYFAVIILYSFTYMLMSNKNCKTHIWSGLYLLNIILQIYLFNSFINGKWIG